MSGNAPSDDPPRADAPPGEAGAAPHPDDTIRTPRAALAGEPGAAEGGQPAPPVPAVPIAPAAGAPEETGLTSSAATHPGAVRKRNEDSLVARPDLGVWAVADGAGGHGSGDVASAEVAAALDSIPQGLAAPMLLAEVRQRLAAAHAALRHKAAALGPERILATTVVVLMVRDWHYACLWAGDSRAYLLRGGALRRLTRDHSLVQQMVDEGRLAAEEAERHPQANIILRAIGAGEEPLALDKVADRIAAGDTLFLCSDGLFKALSEEELAAMLQAGAAAEAIVAAAVERGARDNVTAIALRRAAAGAA